MTLCRKTRRLVVMCGIRAAWQGDREQAETIALALNDLVPDGQTAEQCHTIFAVLLDNRRLTQPSYSPCEALVAALTPPQEATPLLFNGASARELSWKLPS